VGLGHLNLNTVKDLEEERNRLLLVEEELWRQKSRAIWIKCGDRNTKFFHHFASYRRNHKHIWELKMDTDDIITGQDKLIPEAYHYFKNSYSDPGLTNFHDQATIIGIFPRLVSEVEAKQLNGACTKEEIWKVLNSFKRDKIPGPDGWTVEFYLHFFELVGDDLWDLVEDTRIRGVVNRALNSTFLTLIPNTNLLISLGDYRPIALCNLCYKIITKILANRIKPYLSRIISGEQLGFLKGRQILDAIGTAQEVLHNIKHKKLQALILKLDLKKAFDCINWDFLRLILLQSGFGLHFTRWIMGCVTSATIEVLVNGEATPFFHNERGMRQGFPLSPCCSSWLWKDEHSTQKIVNKKGDLQVLRSQGWLRFCIFFSWMMFLL
jgi:hypothetical protein